MRWVEADTAGPADEEDLEAVTAPRPERRRVSRSLIFTLFVLTSIVVTVYTVFPARHNELMTVVIEAHRSEKAFELAKPSRSELVAWGVAVLGKNVPWPEDAPDVEVMGVKSLRILRRHAALVRYHIGDDPVSLLVQKPRDTPPRKHMRRVDDDLCFMWRNKKWTFSAVGPGASADRWARYLGAPEKLLRKAGLDR